MINLHDLAAYLEGRRVFIQTHNFPDADSIASAFGLQYLLGTLGVEARIIYVGKIDKYNTQQMIELLGISLMPAEQAGLQETDAILLVDAQKYNSNIRDCAGDEVACIDHHQIFHAPDYRFCDIRPGTGACSSIIAGYLVEYGVEIPANLATALLYGIKMDTADLVRGVSELDIDMFYHVFKRADMELILKIQLNSMEFNDLTSYAQAIEGIRVFDNIGIARLDGHCPDALIASISDFILALVEVEIALVYNQRRDGIKLSMRSELESCNAGRVLSLALENLGGGGGHATMAGGFIPAEKLSPDDMDAVLEERLLGAVAECAEEMKYPQ